MRTLLFILLLVRSVSGAIYYIDYDAGSDSNSGTSTGAPFKHMPGDVRAASTAAGVTPTAGDTFVLKGGVYYASTNYPIIDINWSGSAGSPITWMGDGSWGTGKPIITTSNIASVAFDTGGSTRSGTVFSNLHFKDIGGYAEDDAVWSTTNAVTAPPDGAAIILGENGTNHKILNCKFEQIGQWQTKAPMSGTLSMTGSGIQLESNGDVLISGCEFLMMRTPISIKTSGSRFYINDITVTNCLIYSNVVWGIDMAPRANNCMLSNILIIDTIWKDYSQCDSGNWTGYGDKPHRDGIFFRTSGFTGSVWHNVVVTRCVFRDDFYETSNGGTASIYISQGPSVTISHCYFIRDPHANGVFSVGGDNLSARPQVVNITNNTFFGSRPFYFSSAVLDTARVMNNAVYYENTSQNGTVWLDESTITNRLYDFNLYFSTYTPQSNWDGFWDGGYNTFTEWQSLFGGIEGDSINDNPDFVDTSGLASELILTLDTGSPALNAAGDGGDIGVRGFEYDGGGGEEEGATRAFSSQIGGRVTFGGKGVRIQ